MGALALFDIISEKLKADDARKKMLAIITTAGCLIVPAIMAHAEWNDHDRSKRTTTRDLAIDYLESCPPNAILFANGDNDTFPLWYAQEVEGIRTDVRVCNLELLGMSWYVDEMNHKAYTSERMPFSLTPNEYRDGTRDYLVYYDNPEGRLHKPGEHIDLSAVMDFIKSDNQADKIELMNGQMDNYLPTRKFKISVNKDEVIKNGLVSKKLYDSIPSEISWELPGNNIGKSTMMVLDAIAHDDWKRPLCFAVTSGSEAYMGLEKYFQLRGLVFLLTPIKNTEHNVRENPMVGTDEMYDNIMHKFRWGNMGGGIYLDENCRRMATELRYQAGSLAEGLLNENKKDSAIKVLNLCMDSISDQSCPYSYDGALIMFDRCYFDADDFPKADTLAEKLFTSFEKDLIYYSTLTGSPATYYENETQQSELILEQLAYFAQQYKQTALLKDFQIRLDKLNRLGLLKSQARQ